MNINIRKNKDKIDIFLPWSVGHNWLVQGELAFKWWLILPIPIKLDMHQIAFVKVSNYL